VQVHKGISLYCLDGQAKRSPSIFGNTGTILEASVWKMVVKVRMVPDLAGLGYLSIAEIVQFIRNVK
jgi:hypothetical protein